MGQKTIVAEPEHNEGDAVLSCILYLREQKMQFHIRLPGLEGNVISSRKSRESLSEMVVKALRTQFGARVEVM